MRGLPFSVAVAGLAAIALLPSACSEGEPGACFRETEGVCVEYPKSQGAAGKRMCSGMKWIPGENACPHDNRLGTCLKEGGKVAEVQYGGPPNNASASSAKNACEWKGGVFKPAGAASASGSAAHGPNAGSASARPAASGH